MGKLERRAEMQDRYCWPHPRPLPPSTVKTITTYISDYSKQEAILKWFGHNKDIQGEVSPRVWAEFLDYIEKNPDIPIDELLNTFEGGHPLLQGRADQRFWALVRLLKVPYHEWPMELKSRTKVDRNRDALCWTCTNLDYDPIYDNTMSQSTQNVPVAGLWDRDTSILDHNPVVNPSLINCHPLPFCPVKGVFIHKGYKHCSSYPKETTSIKQTKRTLNSKQTNMEEE